jgi:HD-GYP domain-containing protein (c-di-GMP phosphodiesterase class II)
MVEKTNHLLPLQTEKKHEIYSNPNEDRNSILSIMARANEITGIKDSSEMIRGVLALMVEITTADSAHYFQADATSENLVITHAEGNAGNKHLIGLRLNREHGLPGIALGDSRVVVVGDQPTEPDWLHVIDPWTAARTKNLINLPVTINKQLLGVIQIINFQTAEMELLMVLCDLFSMEINRRQETKKILQSNQRLLTLIDMLGEVAGTLDRNRLLHLVTENASCLVDAERSSVFLVDPVTREMIYQVAYQARDPDKTDSSTTDQRPDLGDNLQQKHTGRVSTRKRARRFQSGEFSYFNRSAITVPLRSESIASETPDNTQHVLGGLMVLNKQNESFQEEDAQLVNILAEQASTFLQVAEMYESSGELFLGVIKSLATAIDAKDPYTQGHSQRVSDYSVQISQELGFDETFTNDLRIGSLFHDIGKIGIPDNILLKNGSLNEYEMDFIKLHPQKGVNILSQVKLLEPTIPAILEHHERLDGSGYPAKLHGKQISWMGRIVAVADVYDAMTSNRPYRMGLSSSEVMTYLRDNAGITFDVECVQALERVLERPAQAGNENP